MLPKNKRLKKSREFSATYNLKKSVANNLLILYLGKLKTSTEIPVRAGFVVAKKVHKKANRRNRAKRLIREAYRLLQKNDPSFFGNYQTLIFLARPQILDADFEQVKLAVVDCFKKSLKYTRHNKIY